MIFGALREARKSWKQKSSYQIMKELFCRLRTPMQDVFHPHGVLLIRTHYDIQLRFHSPHFSHALFLGKPRNTGYQILTLRLNYVHLLYGVIVNI